MDKEKIKEFQKMVLELKVLMGQEVVFMAYQFLEAYFKSCLTFGKNHEITKDAWKAIKEYVEIIHSEMKINSYLLQEVTKIDVIQLNIYMGVLELLNENTTLYYKDIFESIQDASSLKQEYRAKRPCKRFQTLLETDDYWKEAYALTLSFDEILDVLSFPQSFIEDMGNKIVWVDDPFAEEIPLYGVHLLEEGQQLKDYRILVPVPTNQEFAKICVFLFQQAYEVYQRIGTVVLEEENFRERAMASVSNFSDHYLISKVKTIRK